MIIRSARQASSAAVPLSGIMVLLTLINTACVSPPSPRPAPSTVPPAAAAETDAPSRSPHRVLDLSDRQFDAFSRFSRNLADTLNQRDHAVFATALDVDELLARITTRLSSSGTGRARIQAVSDQFRISLEHMKTNLLNQLGVSSRWKFLRLIRRDGPAGTVHSLFRLDFGDEGVQYWEFILQQHQDSDSIRIIDWFSYATGMTKSAELSRVSALFLSAISGVDRDRFMGTPVYRFFHAYRERQFIAVVLEYHNLPEELKNDRLLLAYRLEAAAAINDNEYRRALDDIARYHGEDPRFQFVLVDYHYLQGQYTQAEKALKIFDDYIGGDAPVSVLHASLAYAQGDLPRAIRYCRRAIEQDRGYEQAYLALLDILVAARRYQDAVLVLSILQERFFYRFDGSELVQLQGYTDFVNSPAFRNWRRLAP